MKEKTEEKTKNKAIILITVILLTFGCIGIYKITRKGLEIHEEKEVKK